MLLHYVSKEPAEQTRLRRLMTSRICPDVTQLPFGAHSLLSFCGTHHGSLNLPSDMTQLLERIATKEECDRITEAIKSSSVLALTLSLCANDEAREELRIDMDEAIPIVVKHLFGESDVTMEILAMPTPNEKEETGEGSGLRGIPRMRLTLHQLRKKIVYHVNLLCL